MMFWTLTVMLFLVASLFVVVPLWRRSGRQGLTTSEFRRSANIALFSERSDELENELATGAIDKTQFDALMIELQKALLADVSPEGQTEPADEPVESNRRGATLLFPLLLVLALPVVAYSLYAQWGYIDDVELMDVFQRTVDNRDDPAESQALIRILGEVVQEDAEQPWAWYFLAENFASLGMFNEAQIAYQQSASRLDAGGEKALVLGRVALAMYINAEFQLTPEINAVIEEAREINPNEVSILQLLASDAEQRQDYAAAIDAWRRLIQVNPNSEQADILRRNIASAQEMMRADGAEAVAGPSIDVNVALAEGLQLDPELGVFITARNAEREGMPPLAVTRLSVGDLPTTVRLDNSSAVAAFNLASADTVYVSALVSFSGTANATSGDYRAQTANFSHNGQHSVIDVVISEPIP